MYEVRENRRTLNDGTTITTYTREVFSFNTLKVDAGTTGYRGGDSGHGGRSYFRIEDESSTDMTVHRILQKYGGGDGLEVTIGGDSELETMIRALKFITRVLEEQAEEVYD